MGKKLVPAIVMVTWDANGKCTCNPSDIEVSKHDNNAIMWATITPKYKFTGVEITDDTGDPGGEKEWNEPTIGTASLQDVFPGHFGSHDGFVNRVRLQAMTVTDKFKDRSNHKYTIQYTDPSGNPGSFDPGIKNKD